MIKNYIKKSKNTPEETSPDCYELQTIEHFMLMLSPKNHLL